MAKGTVYTPLTEEDKETFINWLVDQKNYLNGLQQVEVTREVLQTEEGDLYEFKNMVGTMLATLTNTPVIID